MPVRERVLGALDEVRPYLATHGGGVELLDVSDGVVRLRLEGSCNGCPSSALTLQSAVDEAIMRAAPGRRADRGRGRRGALVAAADRDRMPALMRLAQRSTVAREAALEHCELCGTAIGPEHRHVLELATRDVKCACRPCGLLFERAERMRLIPSDVRRAEAVDLGVPVDMAFVVRVDGDVQGLLSEPGRADRVAAGGRRPASSWPTTSRRCWCATTVPGSSASTSASRSSGSSARTGAGITGGAEVRRELDAFFEGLDRRAR